MTWKELICDFFGFLVVWSTMALIAAVGVGLYVGAFFLVLFALFSIIP